MRGLPWGRRGTRRAHEERVDAVLRQATEQYKRAERVAAESMRARQRNHFAEAITQAIRGGS